MSDKPNKLFRILSIDGGGIRGILPGQIVVELENKLRARFGEDKRIADFFDLIAGTSTGGILTCLYLTPDAIPTEENKDTVRPKFTAQEAVDLYLKHGSEIFNIPFWHKIKSGFSLFDEKYPVYRLEELMHEKYGDVKLSQMVPGCDCLIPAFNVSEGDTDFFTSSDARRKTEKDFYIRDVARATSAAPTYFEAPLFESVVQQLSKEEQEGLMKSNGAEKAEKIKKALGREYGMIDGGVFANNPSMCALVEAYTTEWNGINPSLKDVFVLSIGTKGKKNKTYDMDKVQGYGQLGWIVPIIDIMMSGVSETIDYQLKQIFKVIENVNENFRNQYIRLNPEIDERSRKMDDGSPENLIRLKDFGSAAAKEFDEQLNIAIEKLVQGRADEFKPRA